MCYLNLLNSGLRRVVYLLEATESGHVGDADQEFFAQYGLDIEMDPFTYEEWEERYGNA